jgi:AraC-type transcriptional regulator
MLPNTGSEPSRGVVGGDSRSSSRAWRRPGRGRGERWPCTGALDSLENRIPFVAMGRLLHECAVHTGCQHFALLVGQRTHLSHLGLPGQLARHSPTVGAALRTFAVYQHLNNQGMATFLLEKDGVATLGAVVYQKGAEHVDQIYDVNIAATLSIMRELYVAHWRPDRVLFSHPRPVDAGFYRRAFQAPCQFNAERTALVQGDKLSVKVRECARFSMNEFRRCAESIPTPAAPVQPERHRHKKDCYYPVDVSDYSLWNKPYIFMNNDLIPKDSSIQNKAE